MSGEYSSAGPMHREQPEQPNYNESDTYSQSLMWEGMTDHGRRLKMLETAKATHEGLFVGVERGITATLDSLNNWRTTVLGVGGLVLAAVGATFAIYSTLVVRVDDVQDETKAISARMQNVESSIDELGSDVGSIKSNVDAIAVSVSQISSAAERGNETQPD